MLKHLKVVILLALGLGSTALVAPAGAQSPEQFLGSWTLTFEPMGGGAGAGARPGGPGGQGGGAGRPMAARGPMVLTVTQDNGVLAATITGGMAAEPITASNPHVMNGSLMLSYSMSMGGQSAPITLHLTPEGTEMKVVMDIAGMAQRTGSATRQ